VLSFLRSETDRQTIVQLLEAEDDELSANIRQSPILISSIRALASSPPASRSGAPDSPSRPSDDDYDDEDGGVDGEGEGEIASLARRILDLTDDGQPTQGQGQGQDAALRASVHQALNTGQREH
jgi:vacuolar protein 8